MKYFNNVNTLEELRKQYKELLKMKDFCDLEDLLTRLTEATEITTEIRALFNSKNAHIFVAAFKAFTELERKDTEFGAFLQWFIDGGNETENHGLIGIQTVLQGITQQYMEKWNI